MVVWVSGCCLLLLGVLQWRLFTVRVLSVVRRLAVACFYCLGVVLLLGVLQWRVFTVCFLSVVVRRLAVAWLYCLGVVCCC